MAVVATSSKVSVDVVESQIWTGHPKHIDAELMVSIDVVGLILLRWNHSYVTPINASGCWGEPGNLEEIAREFWAIIRPFNDVILQTDDAVGHTVDDPTDCWGRWTLDVTQDMIEASRAQKMEKKKDLKQILKHWSS